MKKYSSSEASKILGVSIPTINNWAREGKIKSHDTIGGHHKFLREDLVEFVTKNKYPMPEELQPETYFKTKKYKVLIADDEEAVVDSLKFFLETIELNLEIEIARNGFEAGMKITGFFPDLVILDSKMPEANGLKVIQAIKKIEALRNIKILVFTAHKEDGEEMMKAGADKLIVKASEESDAGNFKKAVYNLLGIASLLENK